MLWRLCMKYSINNLYIKSFSFFIAFLSFQLKTWSQSSENKFDVCSVSTKLLPKVKQPLNHSCRFQRSCWGFQYLEKLLDTVWRSLMANSFSLKTCLFANHKNFVLTIKQKCQEFFRELQCPPGKRPTWIPWPTQACNCSPAIIAQTTAPVQGILLGLLEAQFFSDTHTPDTH